MAAPKFDNVSTEVIQIASENNVDGILFLVSQSAQAGGSNQYFGRLGIVTAANSAMLRLNAAIYYVDGATGKDLGMRWLMRERAAKKTPRGRDTVAQFSNVQLAKDQPFPNWPQADKDALRTQILELPDGAWDFTLSKLFGLGKF